MGYRKLFQIFLGSISSKMIHFLLQRFMSIAGKFAKHCAFLPQFIEFLVSSYLTGFIFTAWQLAKEAGNPAVAP